MANLNSGLDLNRKVISVKDFTDKQEYLDYVADAFLRGLLINRELTKEGYRVTWKTA